MESTSYTVQVAQNAVKDLVTLVESQQTQISGLYDRIDELKKEIKRLEDERQILWNFNYSIRHDIKGWAKILDKTNISKISADGAKEFLKRTRNILNGVRGKYPDKNW